MGKTKPRKRRLLTSSCRNFENGDTGLRLQVHSKSSSSLTWRLLAKSCLLVLFCWAAVETSAAELPLDIAPANLEAAGNIGCLFGRTLCDKDLEWCYDDYAFGRCLPISPSDLNEDDLYRFDLTKNDIRILEREMERLFALGYRWGHLYTQCVLSNLLDSIRFGFDFEDSICLSVKDQDLEGALKAFQGDVDPWNLAYIKYSPSSRPDSSDFANELYKPSKNQESIPINENIIEGRELFQGSNPGRFRDALLSQGENKEDSANRGLDAYVIEQQLANAVAKVKGTKSKSQFREKNEKSAMDKKSGLNLEFPGQSDNFNGVDIGSKKKGSDEELWVDNAVLDNILAMSSNGVVNDRILQPKIFSTKYNTPDSFRHAAALSGGELPENFHNNDLANYIPFGKDNGNTVELIPEDQENLGRKEELEKTQKEDQLLQDAIDTLEAELLLDSIMQKNANANSLRNTAANYNYGRASDALSDLLEEDNDGNIPDTNPELLFLKNPNNPYGLPYNNEEVQSSYVNSYPDVAQRFPNNDEEVWQDLEDRENRQNDLGDESLNLEYPLGNEYASALDLGYDRPIFLLNRRNRDGYSFERRERLDVKKPGPWYRTVNNYAFDKDDSDMSPKYSEDANPEFGAGEGPADMEGQLEETKTSKLNSESEDWPSNQQVEKKAAPVKFSQSVPASLAAFENSGHFDIIDTSYTNIFLGESVDWNMANKLVDAVAHSLDIDPSALTDITAHGEVVSFKVGPNSKGLNASEVARHVENSTRYLENRVGGVSIIRADAGIRTSSKQPSRVPIFEEEDPVSNQIYIATFAVCALVAAVLIAAVAIFLIRKHSKEKEKLVRLSQDDPNVEACKQYQDLCRARMAGSKTEKMEPIRGRAHKIASKESENGTNSSRSSTSSWSEEPVLTNMDISTGHMVLSYMEDHLKNRDRLDKEWASLCAYEADPCSTAVAEKSDNSKKNRFPNSLPFDHSRVILNDLANVSGSDYINASTITDHDPRNPAYIATQGPLQNTSADFWQMVWEQGSVVIVNLTRLSENSTSLCHRYWPEEGSELHHIYEVHLVSEHIWCDEYLVRSFYLKNLKTGETRTVTQFHFLAWPENGIPQSTKALLEFRRKVNKSYRGRSCPIIVHCSDGAGRTGTYCLIDMVLNRMTKGAKEIDIAASLEHIRDQRPSMVRTKQQFEFVLMAVAEEVHAILKALPQ